MLRFLRSGTHSVIFKYLFFGLILGGTLVGVALFGVQDVFRGGFHTDTVAKIGHEAISKRDVDRLVSQTLRAKRMTREDAYRQGVPLEELQREINSRVFLRAASDMGIVVDDATVRRQIDNLLKPATDKGMTEAQALDNLLQSFELSEAGLVATLKSEIAVENLSHALADGAFAPPEMVNDFMKYRNEWRRGDYIKLTSADAEVKEPSDSDLKDMYQAEMQIHYMQPEYRKFAVLVLNAQSLPGAVQKPVVDAKTFYEQHKQQFTVPEQRVISEVSVSDAALAQSIYTKAAAKKDLKELAAQAGKDKAQFVSDTYTQDSFIPAELADDVFKAPAGTVLPPKQASMGRTFVARVDKIIPASVKSFDEVKADIEKALAAQNQGQNGEAVYKMANDVDEMIGSGKSLAEVAQHYNLKTVDFDAVSAQGQDPSGKPVDPHGVPDFDAVVKTAYSLDKGSTSQPAQAKNGDFFVVELRDIQAAQAKPFESVKADVVKAWKEKQAGMTLDAKADKIMQRLNMGETLEKVADDLHKPIQHTPLLQRNTKPDKSSPVEPGVVLALFSIDKTGQSTAVPGPGAVTILRLVERKTDTSKAPSKEEADAMQSMLSQSLQSDLLEEYRKSLMAKYSVTIDMDSLKRMYAPAEGAEEDQQQ